MKSILKFIGQVVLGIVVGSVVNMGIILVSGHVVPPPPGADLTTAEGIRAALPRMQPVHYLFPFLAHALGTLVGAGIAARFAAPRALAAAMTVAVVFLLGGVMAARMIPAPAWFIALDLLLAYLPFGWLGYRLMRRPAVATGRTA